MIFTIQNQCLKESIFFINFMYFSKNQTTSFHSCNKMISLHEIILLGSKWTVGANTSENPCFHSQNIYRMTPNEDTTPNAFLPHANHRV